LTEEFRAQMTVWLAELDHRPLIATFVADYAHYGATPAERDVNQCISLLGEPAIEYLLDVLKSSGDRSQRRVILTLLKNQGTVILPHVQQRLEDPVWYFVRNLLHLLGELGQEDSAWSNTDVRIADVFDKYVPPSPPNPPINPWTNEPGLRALFGDSVSALNIIPQQVMYRFPSPSAYAETMLTRYGPWKKLADALEPGAFENLKQDLIQEVKRHNRSGDYTLVSPRDYLQVIGVKS